MIHQYFSICFVTDHHSLTPFGTKSISTHTYTHISIYIYENNKKHNATCIVINIYGVGNKQMCLLSETRRGLVVHTSRLVSNKDGAQIQVVRSQWKAERMLLVLGFAGGRRRGGGQGGRVCLSVLSGVSCAFSSQPCPRSLLELLG